MKSKPSPEYFSASYSKQTIVTGKVRLKNMLQVLGFKKRVRLQPQKIRDLSFDEVKKIIALHMIFHQMITNTITINVEYNLGKLVGYL